VADFRISAAIAAIDRITGPVRRIAAVVSSRLTSAFGAAGRASSALAGATLSATGALARYGAAAALAAGAGILKAVDANARAAASMVETAAKAGIAIKTYQELQHAAEMSGAEQGDFDKSLGKFTLTMAGVHAGTGALTGALKKNAPAFLAQLQAASSQTEALELMLGALGELEDPTERARLATLAFGKSGASLSLIMQDGAEGLAAARDEAHKLGKVLSEDGANKAVEYDDAMVRLKGVLAGVVQTIGGRLLPAMTGAATVIGEFISANGDLIAQNVGAFFSTVSDVMGQIPWADIVAGARQVIDAVTPLVTTIVNAIRENWGAISRTFAAVWRVMVLAVKGAVAIVQASVKALVDYVGPLFDGLKAVLEGFAEFVEGVFTLDLGKALGGLTKLWDGAVAAISAIWNALRDVVSVAATAIAGFLDEITPEPLKKAWGAFSDFFVALWDGIVSAVQTAAAAVLDYLGPVIDAVTAVVEGLRFIGENLGVLDEAPAPGAQGSATGAATGEAVRKLFFPTSAVPSAVPGAVAAGESSVKSLVEVRFSGAPEGMTVQQGKTSGPGEVKTSVGRRVAGAGAAL
jgi:hypothetical protein